MILTQPVWFDKSISFDYRASMCQYTTDIIICCRYLLRDLDKNTSFYIISRTPVLIYQYYDDYTTVKYKSYEIETKHRTNSPYFFT